MSEEEEIGKPSHLVVNAWTGVEAPSQSLPQNPLWALKPQMAGKRRVLAAPQEIDERDWTNPMVGWGLVLPDCDGLSAVAKARADDAPEAIQQLLKSRLGAPVLRSGPKIKPGYIRRYYADGDVQDLSLAAVAAGVDKGRVPRYLLIYSGPAEIPWRVQYELNMSTYAGRLDLTGDALENYVAALIGDWAGQRCDPGAPLVWSVDHGGNDITWLMKRVIADRVWKNLDGNDDLKRRRRIADGDATRERLCAALVERTPALIVTTSHGMTGPLDDPERLRAQLGAPVDVNHAPLGPQHLDGWSPSGAIWYTHACCSAGSDKKSRYEDLFAKDGAIASLLTGIAGAAGAMVAPLPRLLLGAAKPLRAFVGHVEPTFDWTLRDTSNRQVLTYALCEALTNELYAGYKRNPIGWALRKIYDEAGHYFAQHREALDLVNDNVPGARDLALYRQLVAMDRQTLVILGDPTVSIPSINRAMSVPNGSGPLVTALDS